MVYLRDPSEIDLIREAAQVVGRTLKMLREHVRPGITTAELDRIAEAYIRSQGAEPAFKGYRGFPASICPSVNEQVVHAIPGGTKLKEGDIISLDVGARKNGYYGDAAVTYPVGAIDAEAQKLLEVTRESLAAGIAQARPGNRVGDIGHAVQAVAEANGFSVVRTLVGHGIGREMHEEPQVPNYGPPSRGPRLLAGQVIAIEPMVNIGGPDVVTGKDGWTVLTRDGLRSAHFEHTVAIGPDGPAILSQVED